MDSPEQDMSKPITICVVWAVIIIGGIYALQSLAERYSDRNAPPVDSYRAAGHLDRLEQQYNAKHPNAPINSVSRDRETGTYFVEDGNKVYVIPRPERRK